jgi:hypothetical protein
MGSFRQRRGRGAVASFGQNGRWRRSRAWLRSAQRPGIRTKADQGNRSGTVASFGQGRNWVRSVKTVGMPVAARVLASFGARGVGFVWSEAGELELGLFGANGARTHAACKPQGCPSCQRASKKESRLRLAEFCPNLRRVALVVFDQCSAFGKLKTLVEDDQCHPAQHVRRLASLGATGRLRPVSSDCLWPRLGQRKKSHVGP